MNAELTKVAMIRDASTPVGQPGKMHLNCPCGAKPEVGATEVLCDCGRRYSPTGWLIGAPCTYCDNPRAGNSLLPHLCAEHIAFVRRSQ